LSIRYNAAVMHRILVIDDHEDICLFMKEALQMCGYVVDTATDGNTGLALQRRQPADVVITDIFMPDADGMETIQSVKKEFPKVKIIAMSGGGMMSKNVDYLSMAREFGADRVLAKPFDGDALLGAVREVLGTYP
jgi:DNA-binding response OmpR family regulator